MFGEVVSVWRKTQTGTDAMGEPIYEWTSEDVANCLIRPLSGEDISEAARPDGVRASYSVAFPKTYLDRDSLRGCKVSFRDLGEDEALDVVGEPDITRPCPTAWDVIAQVGRADG